VKVAGLIPHALFHTMNGRATLVLPNEAALDEPRQSGDGGLPCEKIALDLVPAIPNRRGMHVPFLRLPFLD
jgi:hypothetical protein